MVKSQLTIRRILQFTFAVAMAVVLSACSISYNQKQAAGMRVVHNSSHFLLQASQDEFEKIIPVDIRFKITDQYAD
ncbi:MAG: peptidoglycan DD-endopeptidase/peptidoglycan LD-carboxypeptidase [Sodalis sp. Psp]|nr:peptidoglycan DD-endopeptidase/peptidoglycan LD-carboxypeptidase [Sodalis sp. Psp]MCR3757112.1 peptidoglycan DD-endopeptidase/peptidoglycan LD-carboxypeptidase [Sodalis sp. Ppy]